MIKKEIILRAIIRRVLPPLVRILLRNQVSVSQFIDQVKDIYVEVADKDFSLPSKKNTLSRISVITGLSRKEVLRIKTQNKNDQQQAATYKLNKASNVITGWLNDSDFTGSDGKASGLPLKGDRESFEALVKRYGGDITPRAVLDELTRSGNVVMNAETGQLCLVSFGYVPEQNIEKLEVMSKCTRDFLETLSHNLDHEVYEAYFQRQLTYTELPLKVVNEFKEFSKEKSLEHIFELNRWLANRKKNLTAVDLENEELYRIGLGVYYIQNDE